MLETFSISSWTSFTGFHTHFLIACTRQETRLRPVHRSIHLHHAAHRKSFHVLRVRLLDGRQNRSKPKPQVLDVIVRQLGIYADRRGSKLQQHHAGLHPALLQLLQLVDNVAGISHSDSSCGESQKLLTARCLL